MFQTKFHSISLRVEQIVMKKYFYAMKDIEGIFNIFRCF